MSQQTDQAEGMAKLFALFPRIAAAALGVTAVAYIVGLFDWLGYFLWLGVPWALPALNSAQIMHGSVTPAILCVFFATGIASKIYIGKVAPEPFSHQMWFVVVVVLITVAALWPLLYFHVLSLQTVAANAIGFVMGLMAAVLGTTMAAYLAGRLTLDQHFSTLAVVAFLTLILAPLLCGFSEAAAHLKGSRLHYPMVSLRNNSTQDAYLVTFVGENVLLISQGRPPSIRYFILVKPEDIASIHDDVAH